MEVREKGAETPLELVKQRLVKETQVTELSGTGDPVAAVCTSNDILFIATGDPRQQEDILGGGVGLVLSHIASPRKVKDNVGDGRHDAAVSVLTVSPGGKWVASGSADSTIILWDANLRILAHEWVAHVGGVDRLAFSPSDGQFLASSGKDNAVTIWAVGAQDVVDVKCVIALKEVERMWRVELCGWAGDSLLFTSRTKTKAVVRSWDTRTSTQRQLLAGGSIQVIPSSQDGASGFLVLSTKGNPSILRAREIDKDTGVRPIGFLACDGRTSPPKDASCSSGGRLAIIHGDARVLVWDLEADAPASARPLSELIYSGGNIQGIAVSPDGSQVLAWGGNSMTIWDAHDDFAAPGKLFEGHDDRIVTASFSPDGKAVASASKDGVVRLWNTLNGSCIATLMDHSDSVVCVAFSPDGHLLSSGYANGTVIIHLLRDIILDK
ncbi:hypothetical protein GSI_01695 [Ganoderma sinense ZZ0214-1]|uniref:Uncharacterized protein n=1 Tax=Ganoderma sinense ZZ0214-1 TaxID=1077348 RepID=A0A2G8SQJ4_9APHY|nr:hypothetical protein GSI_01695 [Ganoderma sinense ZZ0214-1]